MNRDLLRAILAVDPAREGVITLRALADTSHGPMYPMEGDCRIVAPEPRRQAQWP